MTETRALLRHLTVLRDEAEQQPVPARKYFAIGDACRIDGYGETLPLLSWVDDNLSKFVVSNAPSTSWGRVQPAPLVFALPNIDVKPKDGIFLITGPGEDRIERHPGGEGELKLIFLNRRAPLWAGGLHQVHVYRLDGVQTRRIAGLPAT